MDRQQLRQVLGDAVTQAPTPLAAADRLCGACVELLGVDGASICYLGGGTVNGTCGSSGALSRTVHALQLTYGEGPCIDAVEQGRPVLAPDLGGPSETRWPTLTHDLLGHGIRAVFALPVVIAGTTVGALDLFRDSTGPLDGDAMTGGTWAAGLAALPLLDLMASDTGCRAASPHGDGWNQLESLERIEVYQATGVIMAALDISPADALARLRAYAVSRCLTVPKTAHQILDRRVSLNQDDWYATNEESEATA